MGRNWSLWRKAKELDRGQDLTEYTLILALVGIVVLSAYLVMGNDLHNVANDIDVFMNTALSAF